jgi:hypothetical protein
MAPWKRTLLRVVLVAAGCDAVFICSEVVQKGGLPRDRTILIFTVFFLVVAAVGVIPGNRRMPREGPTIHYQYNPLQATLPMLAGAWLALGIVAVIAWHEGYPLRAFEFRNFALFTLALPVMSLAFRPKYVTLTPTGLIARGPRTRVIDWRNVANVAVQKQYGWRMVIISDVRGRWTRLHAPWSFLDRDFDAKVRVIRACWLGQHDWSRLPGATVRQ